MKLVELNQKSQKGLTLKMNFKWNEINVDGLEKLIKLNLGNHPSDTIELSDLPESYYTQLKTRLSGSYEVMGTISIQSNRDEKYLLHIRRK